MMSAASYIWTALQQWSWNNNAARELPVQPPAKLCLSPATAAE
jgi:hypothetical protein